MRLQIFQENAHTTAGFSQMLHGVRIGNTDMTFSTCTKGVAGNDCDMLLLQQTIAEFLGA